MRFRFNQLAVIAAFWLLAVSIDTCAAQVAAPIEELPPPGPRPAALPLVPAPMPSFGGESVLPVPPPSEPLPQSQPLSLQPPEPYAGNFCAPPASAALIGSPPLSGMSLAPGAVGGAGIRMVPYSPETFLPTPLSPLPYDPAAELATYRSKYAVPLQRPWVEFWRPFYGPGTYPPASDLLGKTNLLFPHFYVYGDYRTGVGVNRNQAGDLDSWAHRLNLDMDLQITATERIHGFMGPLDKNNQFTRLDFTDDVRFETNAVSQNNFLSDNRKRADVAIVADDSLRADDCG